MQQNGAEPIPVLQVVPAMNAGGMETFIMNVYRAIDRSRVQFDFLYHYDMPCFYDEEILALGGKITKLTVRQDNNLPLYLKELNTFFAAHPEYRVLHGHYSGFGMFYNSVAKKHGVSVRIGHSHNTGYEHNLVGQLDRAMSWFFPFALTDCFACGEAAGRAVFRTRNFTVMPNGVNASLFAQPRPETRAAVRKSHGIKDNEILYGHIGRFSQQKNHPYLLQIFSALLQKQPNARLILLGEGEGLAAAKKLAEPLGDRVIFAGVRHNTADYYRAMDAFLLPSLFEGLPVVLVEAQAAGLPCFVSDTVDPAAAFTPAVQFLPLQDADAWVNAITAAPLCRNADALSETRAAGYDIVVTAKTLQEFYLKKYEEAAPCK